MGGQVAALLCCSILAVSCSNDDMIDEMQQQAIESVAPIEVSYPEDARLQNPYTVENMQRALDSVRAKVNRGVYNYKPTKRTADFLEDFEIYGTHKYVKFVPNNDDEYNAMKQDSTLILFDYPLDYDFPDSYFADRADNATGNELVEYYTTVALDRTLPSGVSKQDLAELYIPENDPRFDAIDVAPLTRETTITNLEDFLHHLLFEAYNNTGNLSKIEDGMIQDPNSQQRIWVFGRRWTPSGRIRIWDERAGAVTTTSESCTPVIIGYDNTPCLNGDTLNCPLVIWGEECEEETTIEEGRFVPVRGAQVLMRQFFTVAQGITDQDGNFTTGRIRGRAKYVVQWERYHYSIRRGLLFQAEMKGPRLRSAAWFRDIRLDETRNRYHGFAHIGAHRYYYGERFGTKTPPRNGPGKRQMKIGALNAPNLDSFHFPLGTAITGFLPQIYFSSFGDPSDQIYGTMVHELAHAAHRNLDFAAYSALVLQGYTNPYRRFNFGDNIWEFERDARRLMETWATTIENEFTLDRYRNELGVAGYDYRFINFQDRTIAETPFYTSAGVDMIDNFNQRDEFGGNLEFPNDNVQNFNLLQLENALRGSYSWHNWENRCFQQNPNNPTRNNLDELFDNW